MADSLLSYRPQLAKWKLMIDSLLEAWTFTAGRVTESIVLPDGCGDLAGKWSVGDPPF